jgi:HK97 gp10 family phage protein
MAKDAQLELDVFSLESLEKAIAKVEKFQLNIPKILDKAIDEIAEKARQRCLHEMSLHDLKKGGTLAQSNLASTIEIRRDDIKSFTLAVNGEYAMYVEFGTGVVGRDNPHPDVSFLDQAWEYDSKGHGEAGWFYYKDGVKYHTRGQEAKPFLYPTYLYVRRIVTRTVNKHIKRALRELI